MHATKLVTPEIILILCIGIIIFMVVFRAIFRRK